MRPLFIHTTINEEIIRKIISKFAASVFLIMIKQKGSYRFVVSYKELNERIETDQYRIPRTANLLRSLEGLGCFTSLDLNSGFFQLSVKLENQDFFYISPWSFDFY